MTADTRCPDCDLDPDDWTVADMRSSLAHLGDFWSSTLEGLTDWAPAKQCRDEAAEQLAQLGDEIGLRGDDAELARALAEHADDTLLAAAVHVALHGVRTGGRALATAGLLGSPQTGRLEQVNAGGGGVPKTALGEAVIDRGGVVGDRQDDRRHHGRPFQALCLWSSEVMAGLRDEGHRLEPGFAGENLTVSGLHWPDVRPGVRLAVGDSVLAEISSYAIPCAKQKQWFVGGDFRRILHDEHPGWSRTYAYVVGDGGTVRPGDPVRLLP